VSPALGCYATMLCDTAMESAASQIKNSPADIQLYILCLHFVSQRTKRDSLYLHVAGNTARPFSVLSSAQSVASNNVLQLITSNSDCDTNRNDPFYYPDQQIHNIRMFIILYIPQALLHVSYICIICIRVLLKLPNLLQLLKLQIDANSRLTI